MYFYVFDSFCQERKHQHDVTAVENRLVTLGIQGRSEKITILKNLQETVRQALKRGATTIVTIGNDATVTKILPLLIDQPVTLGIIPIGSDQTIARALGIPSGAAACDVLSRRVVQRLDLGRADDMYFLFQAQAPSKVMVQIDGQYSVTCLDPQGTISLTNFSADAPRSRPDDGQLELLVHGDTRTGGWSWGKAGSQTSIFPFHRAKVTSPQGPAALLLDGQVTVNVPVTIEVVPEKIEVIVGKERRF